jgi:plasmid stabilization system protein ParE
LKKIVLSDRAEEELESAVEAYLNISVRLGKRFYRNVMADLTRIQQFPDAQPQFDARHRYMIMRDFPYFLIYHETQDFIAVEAVANAYQDRGEMIT